MGKTVLILGGNLAGLGVAHKLLKHTLPKQNDLKVILVSKNSHFYWNIASVRAVIPGLIKPEEILQPIAPGLAQYPSDSVEFIVGTATGLDPDAQEARITTALGQERTIPYDFLLVATGARNSTQDMPWKANGSYEELLTALQNTSRDIGQARRIVIAGAGSTGIEVGGEIRTAFKDKEVILLCADDELLGGDSIASSCERELTKMGVLVRKDVRSESTKDLPDGRVEITLSNREKIVADVFLPTFGQVPNTDFMPKKLLTGAGYVAVDDQRRIKATNNAWAFGDVVSIPKSSYTEADAQASGVAQNIELALLGQEQKVVRGMPVDILLCTIGPNRGVGRVGLVPVPSLAIWVIKGRTFVVERTAKYAMGAYA